MSAPHPVPSLVEQLLRPIPEEAHDRLIKALKDSPAVIEKLTGYRPHRSAIHRMTTHPEHPLRVVMVCGERYTTARWLVQHIVERGAAHREKAAAPTTKKAAKRSRPRTRAKVRARRTEDTLRRHGLASGEA